MIKQVDTMFPRCIFLAKKTNYKELTDKFVLYSPLEETEIQYTEETFNKECSTNEMEAFVFLAKDKGTQLVGYLVGLNEIEVNVGICAHEATHVCKHMEDCFGLEPSANEYRAYITEWYTNVIYNFWKED